MRIEIHALPHYATWGNVTHRNNKMLQLLVGLKVSGVNLSPDETEYMVQRERVQRAVQETRDPEKLGALLRLWEGDQTTQRSMVRLPVACARVIPE